MTDYANLSSFCRSHSIPSKVQIRIKNKFEQNEQIHNPDLIPPEANGERN